MSKLNRGGCAKNKTISALETERGWVWCFIKDERRPLVIGVQAQVTNHLKLRGLRAFVVNVEAKRRGEPVR